MAAPSNSAHPVATLREQSTALEAAMTQCLAGPAAKSVHRVRTATRRIEAQLHLLSMLRELPDHSKPAKKLARRLRKLRREAGRVRDLDVLRDKLTRQIEQPGTWNESALHQVHEESEKLHRYLKRKRHAGARILVHLLAKRQTGIARALQRLLSSLEPASSLVVPTGRLVGLATALFRQRVPQNDTNLTDDRMHDVRKAAKLAGYLLESTSKKSGKTMVLAARLEALQQTGGEWHDLLNLAERCRQRLGKHSLLATHAEALRDDLLAAFREQFQKQTVAPAGAE